MSSIKNMDMQYSSGACAKWQWSVYDHGAITVYCVNLAHPQTEKSISQAVWALMFPRKALIRQSVFGYNTVVVKNMIEAVLIVNKLGKVLTPVNLWFLQ